MKRNSFVFYESFFLAANTMPDSDRLAFYDSLIDYALNGKEPKKLSKSLLGYFALVKPQIDSNNKKFVAGSKGGRKKNQSNAEQKTNGSEDEEPEDSNRKTNGCYSEKPNVNVNVNDNVNVNENVNDNDNENFNENVNVKGNANANANDHENANENENELEKNKYKKKIRRSQRDNETEQRSAAVVKLLEEAK